MKSTPLAFALTLAAGATLADTPVLKVLTYDSFIPEWGPGPAIEAEFEKVCGCDLVYETGGDGAALLARLGLEGPATDIDVVLGLDQSLLPAAHATGLFTDHGLTLPEMPVPFADAAFVPYDIGYFAFVSDKDTPAFHDFRSLAESDTKIVIQDPRSSTPGLGLVVWVELLHGDEAGAIWADLADNIVTVTPGWSEAYGLFLNGEADAVLSYSSSPAYHRIAEEDDSKTWWNFPDGHYMQIELAGTLAGSDQPELAQQFLDFLTSETAQNILPTTNWMFPAYPANATLPEGFAVAPPPKGIMADADHMETLRSTAIEEWRKALSR